MEAGTQSESGREPPAQSDIGIKATRVSETEGGASRIRGTKSILEEELRLCGCIEDLLGSIEIIHHTNIEVIGKGAFLRIYHMIGISILRHTINRMIDEQSCPTRYIIRQHTTHIGSKIRSTITHQQCRTCIEIDIPTAQGVIARHHVRQVQLIVQGKEVILKPILIYTRRRIAIVSQRLLHPLSLQTDTMNGIKPITTKHQDVFEQVMLITGESPIPNRIIPS